MYTNISSFKLYEILRIIFPGYILSIILKELFSNFNFSIFSRLNDIELFTIQFFISVMLGVIIYSFDIPRWFKKYLDYLPTNLIKQKFKGNYLLMNEREIEEEYYGFYYALNSDSKAKTEIQSGFYHLCINLSFVGLIGIIVLMFDFNCNNISILIVYSFTSFLLGILGAFLIYKYRLRYSWNRNFNEFVKFKSKKEIK